MNQAEYPITSTIRKYPNYIYHHKSRWWNKKNTKEQTPQVITDLNQLPKRLTINLHDDCQRNINNWCYDLFLPGLKILKTRNIDKKLEIFIEIQEEHLWKSTYSVFVWFII